MQRFTHVILALALLIGLTGLEATANAQSEDILDLADVPLPVQDLPEEGFQVMAGAYLASDEVAGFIADPRNLAPESVQARIIDALPLRTYVLNLVLPEDRAWQDSPPLALHQTTVHLVDDEAGDELVDVLLDHSNIAFVEDAEPATPDAVTVYWVGESGEQLRTVVRHGNVVLEIVSLDVTGEPDATEHALVVEGTLERLDHVRSHGSVGLSSMAVALSPGDQNADFFNAQQSGVHGVYRFRDEGIQPAIGELEADFLGAAPSLESIYVANDLVEIEGGIASISVSLFEFNDVQEAQDWYESLVMGSPVNQLIDPYFTIAADESWTELGVLGVYRVTGAHNGQNYSGVVEIRAQENIVVAIGYRTIGAVTPDSNTASSIMDHQLECLEVQIVCPPFELVVEPDTPLATPIADDPGLASAEFGWSLPELDAQWIVDEQFTESGYDRIGLRNGVSIFELESVINHHGDPVQCVLDELHLLEEFEDHAVITVWEDADGNTEGGNTASQAWIVYRVEPLAEERADQEYVIRIDCYSLQAGSANLVAKHIAPVDFWEEEQSKGSFIRDSIEFPESTGSHGKLASSAHDRRTTMIYFHDTGQVA